MSVGQLLDTVTRWGAATRGDTLSVDSDVRNIGGHKTVHHRRDIRQRINWTNCFEGTHDTLSYDFVGAAVLYSGIPRSPAQGATPSEAPGHTREMHADRGPRKTHNSVQHVEFEPTVYRQLEMILRQHIRQGEVSRPHRPQVFTHERRLDQLASAECHNHPCGGEVGSYRH